MPTFGSGAGNRQTTSVASRIQLFEIAGMSRSTLPARSTKLKPMNATGLNAESSSKPTTLRFKTHFQCAYGEELRVAGSTEELGNWNVSSAPSLSWNNGHAWTGQVQLEKPEAAKFKLVYLSHGGVVWEPISDRDLKPVDGANMSVDMAWGVDSLNLASDPSCDEKNKSQSNSATEFDRLWNPTPIAESQTPSPSVHEKSKDRNLPFDVTLEPEWGVLNLDGPGMNAAAPDVQSSQDQNEGRGLVKKRKKNKGKRSYVTQPKPEAKLPSVVDVLASNAKSLAIGALAASTMSAVGVHGQDLLMGSITIAAGAAALPQLKGERRQTSNIDAGQAVLSVILGIGNTALKAASIFQAARQSLATRRQVTVAASQPELPEKTIPETPKKVEQERPRELWEEVEVPNLELLEEELAKYVAGLAQEAAEFALQYNPSEAGVTKALKAGQEVREDPAKDNAQLASMSTDQQEKARC